MKEKIKLAILEDHQSIIDGYIYRLKESNEIKIVAIERYGERLEQMLDAQPVDVLIMDINVPTSPDNPNTFPVLHNIQKIIQKYPDLEILVISMLTQQALIRALVAAGISGYIFKDDGNSIRHLAKIIPTIASGGIYFSEEAYQKLRREESSESGSLLTARQIEALSLSAAYPDLSTAAIAGKMGVAGSTLRNLLSGAYLRLGVRTRAAAIARLQQMGLIFPGRGENNPDL
jgi:two-component system nitrate/nitrite response regulator NarL